MATNDTILIDGILDNIISSYNMENTPENRGKAFEDFAISELLKNYQDLWVYREKMPTAYSQLMNTLQEAT